MTYDSYLPPPTGDPNPYRISLFKGQSRWNFQWTAGDEDALIEAVSELAADERVQLDWFDVAMVRQQMMQATTKSGQTTPKPHDI
ncbi:MAG: hypothetical protein P8J89_03715 [Phycisphaerales bacterium]|jgi:hypothetical protein|nr:hypothetical protein [Phycisphaerales bacterium]|tara:strand:+ start:1016 stop:1270 length:255 start_codon:yes stop_codon:yes gene_type:complete